MALLLLFSYIVCNCNGRSDECIFDANVYLQSGNTTGGVCINCQYNTAGNACQKCAEGFYPTAEDLNCTGTYKNKTYIHSDQ